MMSQKSIAIVEDENLIAMEIQDRVERLGYSVPVVTGSGEEALEKMERVRPDLVLMDIMLEGKMDGIETAEQIRNLYDIPIVYLTAYSDEKTLSRAKLTDPYGYILKPLQERELHKTIEMAIYKYEMEKKLKQDKQWFSTTLKSIGDAVITADIEGKIKFMNPVAESLTCWNNRDALNMDIKKVFNIIDEKNPSFSDNPVETVLKESIVCNFSNSTILLKRNGSEIPVDVSAAPIKNDKGTNHGVVLVFRDTTEKILLDRIKDDFIHHVSHELRTPLTVIRESVAQINDGILGEVNEDQKHFLSICLKNADRLRRIVDEILDISKMEAGKVQLRKNKSNFPELVRSVLDAFKPVIDNKGLELRKNIPDRAMEVYVDRDRIIQVLNNLIGNALKFTEKGFIEVTIKDQPQTVSCAITDTGRGIAPDDLPNVFDKFQQFGNPVDPGDTGTGLGLPISKEIILLHKGDIFAESTPNQGSTFTFTLPKYDPSMVLHERIQKRISTSNVPFILFHVQINNLPEIQDIIGSQAVEESQKKMKNLVQNMDNQIEPLHFDSDNFTLLIENPSKEKVWLNRHLLRMIKESFISSAHDFELDFSFGTALYPNDEESIDRLLETCQKNMIHEKIERYKKRILLVDDEEQITDAVKTLLELFGYHNIDIAHSGETVFEKMENHIPELIILDMKMSGMSGYEIIGRLKENFETNDIPILIMSGYEVETGQFNEYISKKAILTVNKPVDAEVLHKMVYYLL
ncbi:response regulator [bacterium]|nr:response regulator [bacterium]RQV94567.1 MAG: response regulator [bacterium]